MTVHPINLSLDNSSASDCRMVSILHDLVDKIDVAELGKLFILEPFQTSVGPAIFNHPGIPRMTPELA
jgi:hypothetical protein